MIRFSRPGIILVVLFLILTLLPSIYLEFTYGENQWMWGFFLGGSPLSWYAFFAMTPLSVFSSLFGGYILNVIIIYCIGWSIEKLYKKLFAKK